MQASGIWGSGVGRALQAWVRPRRLWLAGACVAAVAASIYLRVLSFGFIYDDYWTVVGNTHLDKPLGELLAGAVSGRTIEWNMPDATRPLMGVSLWWDRRLFGLGPAGYHLHSLALYALVCVLVFALAFGLLRQLVPALGAALIYAVSPLHVEVASAVNYREDLLAAVGVFGAAALSFWPARVHWRWHGPACAALWAYALLGKESALIAPAFVAALAILRRPNLGRADAEGVPLGLACAMVAALWLNWRFGVSRLGEQIPTEDYASWADRLLRTCRFEVLSAFKSWVPIAPRPEHAPLGPAHWGWALACFALVAGVVVLARRRSTRALAAAGAVALVAPLLTSPLAAPTNEVADRYWFVSSFAAALLVGTVMARLSARRTWLPVLILAAGGMLATWRANAMWSSEVDLWTFAVQTAPSSPRAWTALARVHRLADQEVLAERAIERALSLRADRLSTHAASVVNALWFGHLNLARQRLDGLGKDTLHGDTLRVARRCAEAANAEAAQACARRSVPRGMVLGDPELLRRVSEQLLGAVPEPPPAARAAGDRADAGAQ